MERSKEREERGGMPGTAFDGSTWVTGAQVGALALGSAASVAVGAALVRKAALEEAVGDTRKKRDINQPHKRERVRLNRAKHDAKLERNASEPRNEGLEKEEGKKRDAWDE